MKTQYIIRTGASPDRAKGWKFWHVTMAGGPDYKLYASSSESARRIVAGFEPNAPDGAFLIEEI